MRWFAGLALSVWLLASSAAAQDTLPTPASYEVDPREELSGSSQPLPEPPSVDLEAGEMPDGYQPFPSARERATRLEVVHWGGGPFRLVLTGAEPGSQPEEICVTPCVRDIEPGRYRVSIGRPRSDARVADDPDVYIARGTNILQLHYDHRVGERSVGWTALLFGASLGASMAPLGIVGLIILLPTFAGLGLVVGLPLIFLGDSARFEIYQPANQPDPR